MRRDFLKAYIMAAFADGVARSPLALFAAFSEDLPLALKEMAEMGGNKVEAALLGIAADVIGKIKQKGIGETLTELHTKFEQQYKRGVAANTRKEG